MLNGKPRVSHSGSDIHPVQADAAELAPSQEYRHILVPTGLMDQEKSTLTLGMQLALANKACITFLHVLPPASPPSSVHWLDAIDELHKAMARTRGTTAMHGGRPAPVIRQEISAFLERLTPARLRQAVDLQVECRWGDVAEEITRFANEARADLVLMSHARSGWRLPFRPNLARRVMRLVGQRVLLVYPPTKDHQPDPAQPVELWNYHGRLGASS